MAATILAIALLLAEPAVRADADAKRSITVPGSAIVEVAPDRLVIALELLTERRSFDEAADGARAMASALGSLDVHSYGVSLSVDYDLTFMKQKSWGRGRKLEHRFEMTVEGVPDGKAQEVMVHLVDKALELDNSLTVEHFDVRLSEEREQATRKRLLEQAVLNARTNAEVLAAAAGLQIVSPLAISVGGCTPLTPSPSLADMDAFVPGRFYQNAFAVDATLPSRIAQRANVVVQFEVE